MSEEDQLSFQFKEVDEPVYSGEAFYDFFYDGSICPVEMLEDEEQAAAVIEARSLILQFLDEAEEAGALETT